MGSTAFLLVDVWLPGQRFVGACDTGNGDVIQPLKYRKTPERKELEKNEDVGKKIMLGWETLLFAIDLVGGFNPFEKY